MAQHGEGAVPPVRRKASGPLDGPRTPAWALLALGLDASRFVTQLSTGDGPTPPPFDEGPITGEPAAPTWGTGSVRLGAACIE